METYTIGQAAARTGRTVSALRYYDKGGASSLCRSAAPEASGCLKRKISLIFP